jgi:hypothetical protein
VSNLDQAIACAKTGKHLLIGCSGRWGVKGMIGSGQHLDLDCLAKSTTLPELRSKCKKGQFVIGVIELVSRDEDEPRPTGTTLLFGLAEVPLRGSFYQGVCDSGDMMEPAEHDIIAE